ncbi:MAG: c-type cytochrome [Candidatus Binatia bacterium]|nr:c-type cytochrome [Candidatus Binatia bacterium]
MKRALVILVVAIALGWVGWRLWRGPDPAAILAAIDVPPAPVLSPEDELATFRLAPGFRAELVAAEPLVVDPVAMDWDDEGRLYVVEMRGFMPDVYGNDEDIPNGRIVVLEDTDGDGRMDQSHVFLDGLVMPRAIAVLPEGVLVAEPPNLWLCRSTGADPSKPRCDEKTRLTAYAEGRTNPEHMENGLLPGIDNWIYNSRSKRRFRFHDEALQVEPTQMRGQWGIAQDDDGRLYYNHNSGFLYGDAIPADYPRRQPATGAPVAKAGVNVPLSDGEFVHGVRVAPGLNRAYLKGTLRADGRQNGPTAVSGLAIQRGDQFGPAFVGDAFVPESGGSAVARFSVERDGTDLSAEHHLYDDPQWGKREFLASTDERFRPVDAHHGPDGAIWVIDMYRGVIQHAEFVSDYLREYIQNHELEEPGATGRLWRIVKEDQPLPRQPPSLATTGDQIAALEHPNGWVRDHAQRRLVHERSPAAAPALRRLADFAPLGRRHALWTLEGMEELDVDTWQTALRDDDARVRVVALRAGEPLLYHPGAGGLTALRPLLEDDDPEVRLQALHSLGALPAEERPLEEMLATGRMPGDPLARQAVVSGLSGLEADALQSEVARAERAEIDDATRQWLALLARAAQLSAKTNPSQTPPTTVLDLVLATPSDAAQIALLTGLETAWRSPGGGIVELPAAHPLFSEDRESSVDVAQATRRVRRGFTWPGDPRPGGARALSPDEEKRRTAGKQLFADSCAACHGATGRGLAGQAPALAGSPWARDSDDWLVRIVLDGLTGPIEIDGKEWNLTMPGHGDDTEHFGDEALAGLLTYMRRAWGHAEDPISPDVIAGIREATAGRTLPWTVKELHELPIRHRLDRYVGAYQVPVIGTELVIVRQESVLAVGQRGTGKGPIEEAGDGLFLRDEMSIQFETDEDGTVTGATASYNGMEFPVTKTE